MLDARCANVAWVHQADRIQESSGALPGYRVVVTNTAGSVTSAVAVLIVLVPTVIVSQPTNQTVV
jgi:hypothetical protein